MDAKSLEYLKSLKVSLNEAKEDLVDESHQRAALESMCTIHIDIKKEQPIGRRGGGKRWPVHIVQLIFEILVNGPHPSAVLTNIQTSCAAFTGIEADELPRLTSSVSAGLFCKTSTGICQHFDLLVLTHGIKFLHTERHFDRLQCKTLLLH